ncbi:hypothetical protein Nepgr_018734 [Nepenthes gracilis]|uniref:Uncharacterized protein n=1 Tax=Nepenthes gracilis TaxID=150966 RepID=A0AAD3SRW5_NEPGR|nr:hypothetical protein Nepgr_018734 [Nepenthes gracilis]
MLSDKKNSSKFHSENSRSGRSESIESIAVEPIFADESICTEQIRELWGEESLSGDDGRQERHFFVFAYGVEDLRTFIDMGSYQKDTIPHTTKMTNLELEKENFHNKRIDVRGE